jgi:hypothetical protein
MVDPMSLGLPPQRGSSVQPTPQFLDRLARSIPHQTSYKDACQCILSPTLPTATKVCALRHLHRTSLFAFLSRYAMMNWDKWSFRDNDVDWFVLSLYVQVLVVQQGCFTIKTAAS